jgi:hypothetical protein
LKRNKRSSKKIWDRRQERGHKRQIWRGNDRRRRRRKRERKLNKGGKQGRISGMESGERCMA